MRIVQLTNADGEQPLYLVAEHIVGVADVGSPTEYEADGVTVAVEGYPEIRVYTTGGQDLQVSGTLADVLSAIEGTNV